MGALQTRQAGKLRPPGLPVRPAAETCPPQMGARRTEYKCWGCGRRPSSGSGRLDPAAARRGRALTALRARPHPWISARGNRGAGGGGRTGAGPADSLVVRPRAGPGACQAQRPRRLGRQAPHNTEKGVQRGDRIERADRKLPRKSWRVPSSGRVFLAAGTASAKALRQERHCGAEGKGGQPGVVWPFFRPWDVMQGRDTV